MGNTSKEKILSYIDDIKKLKCLDKNQYIQEELTNITNRLVDEEFKIAIVGEFSAGKSTFINAILGKDLLKHASVETTATITYIHNVTKEHPNYNKCMIEFMDGSQKIYDGIEDVTKWTTTASEEYDVSAQIAGVHLYRKFLENDISMVLVDTPGLNGIADNHRDLTINEVKKAHSCIYLLQLRGLSASDIEFVKYLVRHQNKFIFVQNFIDELHISEGETVQSKLDEVTRILKEQIQKEQSFEYALCGVSALKALAAQDKEITKLYSSDYRELTDLERENLWEQSQFEAFKAILEKQLDVKALRQIQCEVACHGLLGILEEISTQLVEEQAESKKMMLLDDSTEIVEKCQKLLMKLQKDQDKNREKVTNFIVTQQAEISRLMKGYLEEEIGHIEQDLNSKIDQESDYEAFNEKIKSKYYTNQMNISIDQVHKESIKLADHCLEQLSNNALLRLKEYVGNYQSNIGKLDLKYTALKNSQLNDLSIQTKKNEIEKLQETKELYAKEMGEGYSQLETLARKLKYNTDEEQNQVMEMKRAEADYQAKMKRLGQRPEAEIRYREEVRKKTPTGFWGKVKSIFVDSYETVTVSYKDNSNVVRWENDRASINNAWAKERDQIQKNLDTYRKMEADLKRKMEIGKGMLSNNEQRLKRMEKTIKDKEEELKLFETKLKKEYLKARKQGLKKDIRKHLLDVGNSKSVINVLEAYMQKDIKRNVNKIQVKVLEDYNRSLKKKEEELKDKIKGNKADLEKRYVNYQHEIKQIEAIKKLVEGVRP